MATQTAAGTSVIRQWKPVTTRPRKTSITGTPTTAGPNTGLSPPLTVLSGFARHYSRGGGAPPTISPCVRMVSTTPQQVVFLSVCAHTTVCE